MQSYVRETDKDWRDVRKKIDSWRSLPQSTLLYDDVIKAFERMRVKGEMTPLVRREYERILSSASPDTYIQPVTEEKYQEDKSLAGHESELLQLTLMILPETYHPKVVTRSSVSHGILSFLTSIDLEEFGKWCTKNVCNCCMPQLDQLWCQMCVTDIQHVMKDMHTLSQKLCSKQQEHYRRLLKQINLKGNMHELLRNRVVVYNELLFLKIKTNQV
jgi:hypothetical protein